MPQKKWNGKMQTIPLEVTENEFKSFETNEPDTVLSMKELVNAVDDTAPTPEEVRELPSPSYRQWVLYNMWVDQVPQGDYKSGYDENWWKSKDLENVDLWIYQEANRFTGKNGGYPPTRCYMYGFRDGKCIVKYTIVRWDTSLFTPPYHGSSNDEKSRQGR